MQRLVWGSHMASGLVALLDDVAGIAKIAAASLDDVTAAAGKAGSKAVGVVVDDTAVTPGYAMGFTPDRELPIVLKIAIGSLRNKILFLLPGALLLSAFAPWAVTPLLMMGGAYLCFEATEKIIEAVNPHDKHDVVEELALSATELEKQKVSGAIRTDLILSAEIMVIALKEVIEEPLVSRAAILVVVALVITAIVYGLVAAIVKMDDVGLSLAQRPSGGSQRVGRALVTGMPVLLRWLSRVGTAAMLWVGGHILLVGADELGWHGPYEVVHHLEEAVHDTGALSGVLEWVVNTAASAIVGLVAGVVVVIVVEQVQQRRGVAAAH